MSERKTQFIVLPNEVIYCIFDLLATGDILRAFVSLNHRYADLVRFYVKQLDLTNGWQGDRQQLQWICETIQILKIDRFHMDLLDKYSFSQLHSLHLLNVSKWNNVVLNMNLKSLSLQLDKNIYYYSEKIRIPQTIIRFSANTILKANVFHINLIDINVCIRTMVHLLEIIERTPYVQRLSVIFVDELHNQYGMENNRTDRFDEMINNFHCLNNLNRFSFTTQNSKDRESNERFSFNQIKVFVEQCCPSKTVLKKFVLKLDYILFHKDIWSTIIRYKNTFDRFDFYASFIVEENASENIEIPLNNDRFDFHIEDGDSSHSQIHYVHLYSLPFAFDRLHGFTSCSELSPRCSFSAVRHLYFTHSSLNRLISFESLVKRMPHLVSIDCHFTFVHDDHTTVPEVSLDRDIFNSVRILCFTSHYCSPDFICRDLLTRLLERMPHLECLTTSDDAFIHAQRPLPSIKRLVWPQRNLKLFHTLAQCLPHLMTLSLGHLKSNPGDLSRTISSLFIHLPSLYLVSFRFGSWCGNDETPYGQLVEEAFALTQNMNNRLHRLRLDFGYGLATFYLPNPL